MLPEELSTEIVDNSSGADPSDVFLNLKMYSNPSIRLLVLFALLLLTKP